MPYEKHLQWLATMARHPGFRAHATHRALELERDESGLFRGIYQAAQELHKKDGQDKLTASAIPSPEKLA